MTGLDQFEHLLDALLAQTQRSVMNEAVRAGGTVVLRRVKPLVPVDTGELKKSATVRTLKIRGNRVRVAKAIVGFRRPRGRIAHLLEFGTKYVDARHFIAEGTQEAAGEAVDKMALVLASAIRRRAAAGKVKRPPIVSR